ncbi:MAG: MFS transporter [Alistipes sp.]|nr:MFS transporter [Candidatus Alistipes equi]
MALLKNRNFLRVIAARFLTDSGNKFFLFAVEWWLINSAIEHNKTILGVIMGASTAGLVIFSPMMGVFADRYNRKKCMVVALLLSVVILFLTIVLLPIYFRLPLLFALSLILTNGFGSLYDVAQQTSLGAIAGRRDLSRAVSMTGAVLPVSAIIGSILCGIVIQFGGIYAAFWADIVMIIMAAILSFRVTTPLCVAKEQKDGHRTTYWDDFKEVFSFLNKERPIMYLLLLLSISSFFIYPMLFMVPIFAKEVFHGTPLVMSMLEFMIGAGVATGAVTLSVIKKKINRDRLISISFIGIGLMYILMSVKGLTLSCIALFGFGLSVVSMIISLLVIAQNYIPSQIQGRAFSVAASLVTIIAPLGMTIAGFMTENISLDVILISLGAIVLLCALLYTKLPKIDISYKM